MDSAAPYLNAGGTVSGQVPGLLTTLADAAGWLTGHWYLFVLALALVWGWARSSYGGWR